MKILPIALGLGLIASPAFAIRPFPPHPMPTETQRAPEPSMQDQLNAAAVAVNQIVLRLTGQIAADQQTIEQLKAQIEKLQAETTAAKPSSVHPVAPNIPTKH